MKTHLRVALMLLVIALAGCSRKASPDAASLENSFQEMMSGATLVGHSTFNSKEGMSGEERYMIDRVSKLTGDTWLFQARMRLRTREIPLPIPVTIKWAGDTPVITLTDVSIPGLGTFTARVVLYRDQYAGTWSGHGAGGQMFGKIVHEPAR